MEVLREIIPIYDKVNSIISLGKDKEHRIRGISKRVLPGNKILDAGSGFGNMSKTAMRLTDGEISITLYDPLVPMLKKRVDFLKKHQIWQMEFLSTFHFKMKNLMQSCVGIL